MGHSLRTMLVPLLMATVLAGCEQADQTMVNFTHETTGTIADCCALADGDWSMIPVGQTGNQATLSYKGEERGFMELRDGRYDSVSDRIGFVATTLDGRAAAIQRPDGNGQALMALVGNVNEYPEHLSIQIRCETVDCPEYESLMAALMLPPVSD